MNNKRTKYDLIFENNNNKINNILTKYNFDIK